jgi:hypothetical protein
LKFVDVDSHFKAFNVFLVSDMGTTAASLYGNSTRLVANSGSSSISGRGSFGNSIGGEGSGSGLQMEMSDDNGSLQSQGYQQAVILDDNGQPTDEIVLLAPNDAGEFQVVERSGGRDFLQSQEYYSTSTTATSVSSEKGDGNTFQHQGQTIIICQDEEGNQMQVRDADELYPSNGVISYIRQALLSAEWNLLLNFLGLTICGR